MRIFLATWFSVLVVAAFGQGGDTVFTVKVPASAISLTPDVHVLYNNFTKKFKIIKQGRVDIDTVAFTLGKVQWTDSTITVKPSKTGTAILKIYQKTAEGKNALAFIKEFEVQKFIEPKPNLDGVNCDSAIHRMKVVAQGYINVPYTAEEALKRIGYQVLSFQLITSSLGKWDTLKADGNRLNLPMKNKVDSMQGGNVLEFSNIKYKMAEDTFVIKQPLRVYLINDTINKF